MLDRRIRAFLVVGGVSVACAWTWPGAFPAADPVAVLVRYHTPNLYRAVVVWSYVAPGVAVFLAGQFLLATSRIWFARMSVSVGLRSRLPKWPLSPTADGPAIVVGEVHRPVRAIDSPAPEWLTIPERGLYTGVAMDYRNDNPCERIFVQAGDETESAVRTWGSQHAALWLALAAAGRAVEVVVVGRDPVCLAAGGRVLDRWASTPPESLTMAHEAAAAELAAIRNAIATGDWAALQEYGGLNPALQRTHVLDAASARSRRSRAAITRGWTWRSTRVPPDPCRP